MTDAHCAASPDAGYWKKRCYWFAPTQPFLIFSIGNAESHGVGKPTYCPSWTCSF